MQLVLRQLNSRAWATYFISHLFLFVPTSSQLRLHLFTVLCTSHFFPRFLLASLPEPPCRHHVAFNYSLFLHSRSPHRRFPLLCHMLRAVRSLGHPRTLNRSLCRQALSPVCTELRRSRCLEDLRMVLGLDRSRMHCVPRSGGVLFLSRCRELPVVLSATSRYGFVQVSPPQETVQGSQWWTDYQARHATCC
jgi:hypothetical protein